MLHRLILFFLVVLITPLQAQLLQGRVRDAYTRQPLAGVSIIIEDLQSAQKDSVTSGEDGTWALQRSTGINGPARSPQRFELYPNFPNPFNPSTVISFQTPHAGAVQITVYNVLGQLMDTREAFLAPGPHRIGWDSRGSAGVYVYRIRFGQEILQGKMLQLDDGNGSGLTAFHAGSATQALSKAASGKVALYLKKFAYACDTLQLTLQEAEWIEHGLETIHRRSCVIDLHNDILERMYESPTYHLIDRHTIWQTDIPRLEQGGIDLQFFAIWVNPKAYSTNPFQTALAMIERMKAEIDMSQGRLLQAFSAEEAEQIVAGKKIAYMFGVEGGHTIENDLQKLYQLYHHGMRYLTITWNNSTDWAVSCDDARRNTVGLSEFGRRVIRACDSLGVMIDVSHVGAKTIQDILLTSKNPIVATHSGAYALRAHQRNLSDAQIRALAATGGVVGVIFYPSFLVPSGTRCDISSVIRHIDHLVQVGGIDHVALGSDFDGVSDVLPRGLEDVTKMPDLTAALLAHGYTSEEVQKILGRNMLRVIRRVCQ